MSGVLMMESLKQIYVWNLTRWPIYFPYDQQIIAQTYHIAKLFIENRFWVFKYIFYIVHSTRTIIHKFID